jgi:AcrR family transcriptional regulator
MYAMSTSKRSYHHGQLRQTLVSLALEALETTEPEAVTLRGLAEKADVSPMAPYRHFADKAALMQAVAVAGFVELRKRLLAVDDPTSPRRALVAFASVYVRFACERPRLYRVMFGGPPPTPDESLSEDETTVYGLFTRRLGQIVEEPRRGEVFLACWSLVHGLATLLISGRIRGASATPEELGERLARSALAGLLGPEVRGDFSQPRDIMARGNN